MDASLLLDTFNMDDIDVDIWDNYNLFTDDNIISVQDSIKEENIERLLSLSASGGSIGSDTESNISSSGSYNPSESASHKTSATLLKRKRQQAYQARTRLPSKLKSFSTIKVKESTKTSSTAKLLNHYIPHSALNPDVNDECWPFLCSLNKLPTSGPLLLTEEEKRTLKQENIQIPTQLPLSKHDEKLLKKIRRKIKNKISAQESRRKKKEYVDSLEKHIDLYINENVSLKKQVEDLEEQNKLLMTKLQKMQGSLSSQSDTSKFGTSLIVVVFFIAVLLGFWCPIVAKDQLLPIKQTNDATSNKSTGNKNRLRSLVNDDTKATRNNDETIAEKFNPDLFLESNNDFLFDFASFENEKVDEYINVDFDRQSNHAANAFDSTFSSNANDDIWTSLPSSPTKSVVSSQANSGRSKSGIAVELTKVRPFVPKVIKNNIMLKDVVLTTNTNVNHNQKNSEPQIIILNLSKNMVKSTTNVKVNALNNFLPALDSTSTHGLNIVTTNQPVKRSSDSIFNTAEFLPTKCRFISGPHASIIKLHTA